MLWLLACGGGEPSLTQRWEEEPEQVAAEIAGMEPIEQLAAVEEILVADPQNAGRLCGMLQDGPARSRCRSVQRRPHLWQERPAPQALPSPFADIPAATGHCDTAASPTLCWSRHAAGRASAGDAEGAAAGCTAITEVRWQEECMFQSAESLLSARGGARYADAISLCARSGPFLTDCLEHSIATLAAQAPATPGGDWLPILAAAQTITDRWQDAPARGEAQRQALWALASALAYVEAPAVSGAPLSVLPEDAWPHVRAAMAWRLVALRPEADFAGLTEALAQAEADRQDTAPPTAPRRALVGLPVLWDSEAPPGGAEVVDWMGVSRRVVSPDPRTDGAIALLEAAARQPSRVEVVRQGRTHPDPLVSWTAQRLLSAHLPTGAPP